YVLRHTFLHTFIFSTGKESKYGLPKTKSII
ncbi:hypothetical protein DBR06_SOUSAS7710069, partial [Sousa chinensis]